MYGTLISSITVGATPVANMTFSAIPGTFTDLIIVVSCRGDAASIPVGDFYLQFNGTSGTAYSSRMLNANAGSVASNSTSSSGAVIVYYATVQSTATANTFGSVQVYIPNYAGASNKSVSIDAITENNAAAAGQDLTAALWANTAAITSIAITSSGNFVQYSTAYLYGLTKGSGGATVS